MPQPIFTPADVRTSLVAANARWTVDSKLAPDDTPPQKPLGADPRFARQAAAAAKLDIDKVLATNLGSALTLQRKVKLGIMPGSALTSQAAAAAAPAAGAGPDRKVDWRNRWGTNWLCKVRDQDPCESCWAFSATSLVESMTRIEHGVWAKRSEGDVHDGMGAKCADGGWPDKALDWMKGNGGLADPSCWPYHTDNAAYHPSSDRTGRTVRIGDHVEIGDVNQQKRWLDTVGPLTGCFEVWHDFDLYGQGVYHKIATVQGKANYSRGLHAILVVGYDEDQQCWICRNSWGPGWGGLGGYFLMGYGEVSIDLYSKFGIQGVSPDPVSRRTQRGGGLMESSNGGEHRNFEMMVRTLSGQAQHWWRDGGTLAWTKADLLGGADEIEAGCSLIQTSYNRNMEFLYEDHAGGLHHRFFDYGSSAWKDGGRFGPNDLCGQPGFIQGVYGTPGNFEVVIPTTDGRLAHWWRIDGPPWTWSQTTRFGTNIARCGAALLESRYGARKSNLEVVAVLASGSLQHFTRNDSNPASLVWQPGPVFGAGVSTTPCLIEGQFGAADEDTIGNFELCVAVNGQVEHWWRNNAGGAAGAWARSATFGQNVKAVIGLVEGSFGFNLEVVVLRNDNQLHHYWRGGSTWNDGGVIGSI